jgi:sphinganine C4-monooxygenase
MASSGLFGTKVTLADFAPSRMNASEFCMVFLPVILYWTYSTILYILSTLKLTRFEIHRIPTDQPTRVPNRVTVPTVLLRVFIQHSVQMFLAYGLMVFSRPDDLSQHKMEPLWLLAVKLPIACVMLDSYQYWMHRWMHVNRWLYRNIHSIHHELTVPYAFGALYNHPIEGLIMDTVGSGIPSILLDMHPWTCALFFSFATLKTVDDHCGYALPWDPLQFMFPNNAAYHDIHHWGKGRKYNFSQPFFTFWDKLCGTEWDAAVEEKEQQRQMALRQAQEGKAKEHTSDRTSSLHERRSVTNGNLENS